MTEKQKIRTSKYISYLLRHNPEAANLKMTQDGWVNVSGLLLGLAEAGYKISRSDLEEIVATDDKQRYSFDKFKANIRANQGHSIKVDLGLKPIDPPAELYHGTATHCLGSILDNGLKPMSRQMVHLSADEETAEKVGKRHGNCVILLVDTAKMNEHGIKFYKSENGVWLTDAVPHEYLSIYKYVG